MVNARRVNQIIDWLVGCWMFHGKILRVFPYERATELVSRQKLYIMYKTTGKYKMKLRILLIESNITYVENIHRINGIKKKDFQTGDDSLRN